MLAELSERLDNANKELSTCPEGTLSYVKRGETGTFFQIINFGGKRLRKSINKAPDFIRGLARKEYLIKEKKLLERSRQDFLKQKLVKRLFQKKRVI